jgi:transcriptional regulator with XRE-family HTH domain
MSLKGKIIQLLAVQNLSYENLAQRLGLNEEQLDAALETEELEVRTLELISKELRIPLYSFFREETLKNDKIVIADEPYYNVNIWSSEEIKYKTEIAGLKNEISRLHLEMSKRDLIIEALEGQLKNS